MGAHAAAPRARAAAASGRGRVMASVSFTSRMSLRLAGTPRVTSPAPARSAASAARAAAPVLPTEPARTSRWPKFPLWLPTGRDGSKARISRASASSTGASRARIGGMPISTCQRRPT